MYLLLYVGTKMKAQWFKMRISQRRLDKLRLYAAYSDKTMTQVVEELIDSLKTPEIDKNSTAPSQVNPEA
ncbi:hypothetical protein MiSe_73320 [Microseira wollei NIES-4236]|uniref:CopG domain protein DNA-binding domain protein n=1 Tax=Microseira wollei NIES-4236 TaxID=2530354 RepID=A0AAV3XJ86_9CYAN|nr:hypothetical protein MiSe_73320 [Microseira wollei NIES-4236]